MKAVWLVPLYAVAVGVLAYNGPSVQVLGPQAVNLWKLQQHRKVASQATYLENANQITVSFNEFPEQWFEQPLDHFDKSNTATFRQRYWINTRHYKPGRGGPVIVLDGGETSGENRIPFLDTGIVEILARATSGVGVVLEHRYYGDSIAVQNLTTDSLRWLTNEQAAADSANFMENVNFTGISEDLTSPNTPWIYYGGSYAGARAAHMKILYPDLVYGAIASSGVTHAAISNWEYMDVIRLAAPQKCSHHLEKSVQFIDTILAQGTFRKSLKALFGLADLEHDDDFVSVIESPLGSWQSKCWNSECGSDSFDEFCEALSKPPFYILNDARNLDFGSAERLVHLPGGFSVDFAILNYAKYIKTNVVGQCPEDNTIEECFGTYDDSQYLASGLDQTWRLWLFQVCTQWGYFTTAPPDPEHPRIISNLLTLDYESKICKQAYPPGKFITVPALPNVTAVNALGDFDITADHLAIIDGEVDPWRPNTPHSRYANDRPDTMLQPFKLIPNAVHHYDEYGLRNLADEPEEIRRIHGEMIVFVMSWIEQWEKPKA